MARTAGLRGLTARSIQGYGWLPDIPDARDYLYAAPEEVMAKLPSNVDLRPHCPPVYDQGQLGSCTANAIGAAHAFAQLHQFDTDFMPSRLFIYFNERTMERTVDTDSGAMIRDGIKSVAKLGVCPETMWPYEIAKFRDKPLTQCYTSALKNQAVVYRRVLQSLGQLQGCLASGTPFVFGFSVYEAFESQEVARTGVVPMPARNEKMLGGHAVLAVGYDDASQRFIVRNSWGDGWGDAGYFTMPYAYITSAQLASDFWTITSVEEPSAVKRTPVRRPAKKASKKKATRKKATKKAAKKAPARRPAKKATKKRAR
jgi:C1A family cysteine protease